MPIRHLSHRNLGQLIMHRLAGQVANGGQNLNVLTRLEPEPEPPNPAAIFHYARLMGVDVTSDDRHETAQDDQDIEHTGEARAVILLTTVHAGTGDDAFAHEGFIDAVTAALCSRNLTSVTEFPVTANLDTRVHFTRYTSTLYADEADGPLTVRTLLTFIGRASAFPVT